MLPRKQDICKCNAALDLHTDNVETAYCQEIAVHHNIKLAGLKSAKFRICLEMQCSILARTVGQDASEQSHNLPAYAVQYKPADPQSETASKSMIVQD